jgi:hypothetical protein
MRFVWFALLAACGDSSTTVDAAFIIDDAPSVDAAVDAAVDAVVGCGVLDPADVVIDKASTARSVGTPNCPFHSITEALALPAPASARRIRVHPGTYVEPILLAIPNLVTLEGAAAGVVIGGAGGACAVTVAPSCTISLAGGATLRAVTVTNTTGNAVEVRSGVGPARIEQVTASTAKHNGFAVRADVILDQSFALDNDADGLDARTASVTITSSEFRLNAGHGLDIDQGATLTLTTAKIHNNQGRGIFLHNGSQLVPLAHAITNADIQQNLFAGIDVATNASLTLRGTTMYQNEFGVLFGVGSTNKLDIGTAAQAGTNIFAGTTAVNRNVRAGLCMEQTGATATQVVEGNSWRVCPPPQRKITGPFCVSNNTYSDIDFVPAVSTSGSPALVPAACTVGQ